MCPSEISNGEERSRWIEMPGMSNRPIFEAQGYISPPAPVSVREESKQGTLREGAKETRARERKGNRSTNLNPNPLFSSSFFRIYDPFFGVLI